MASCARGPATCKTVMHQFSKKAGPVLYTATVTKGAFWFVVCSPPPPLQAHQLMVDMGVSRDNIFTVDLSSHDPGGSPAALKLALQGCDALVICTSAVPQPKVLPTLLGAAGHWLRQRVSRRYLRYRRAWSCETD